MFSMNCNGFIGLADHFAERVIQRLMKIKQRLFLKYQLHF